MSDTIAANKIGIFNYELKDENGEILDSSQGILCHTWSW